MDASCEKFCSECDEQMIPGIDNMRRAVCSSCQEFFAQTAALRRQEMRDSEQYLEDVVE